MKYVLDSCVAVKWAIPEADSDRAVRVRDDFRAGLTELICVGTRKIQSNVFRVSEKPGYTASAELKNFPGAQHFETPCR
jgi:hypothetical protein